LPPSVFETLVIPIFVLVGLWYWLFHYDDIKTITAAEYSNEVLTPYLAALYFGFFLSMLLVAGVTRMIFGDYISQIAFIIAMVFFFGLSIFVYMKKTEAYRQEGARYRTRPKLKKTILVIACIYMVVSIGSGIIGPILFPDVERKTINIDLTGRTFNTTHDYGDGRYYEGSWIKGKGPHGKGKLTLTKDNIVTDEYEGEFSNGAYHGKGIYKNNTLGQVYEGSFDEGNMHGRGKMTYPDGRVEEGNWERGKFIGDVTSSRGITKNAEILQRFNIDPSLNGIGNPKYLRIRMRAEPNRDAAEIGHIPVGEFFIIKERGKGDPAKHYYKVEHKGKEGYATVESVKKLKNDRTATVTKNTHIRNPDFQNARSVSRGTKVILLGENNNDFIKVYYDGEGWIYHEELKW